MQSWKHESLFTEYIAEEDLVATSFRTHRRKPSVNPSERGAVLQKTVQALQRLQTALVGHDLESNWTSQLVAYIQRLQSVNPPTTPEEQFTQLYYLRKWLFWVPITLLQQQQHGPAMLTLSHFYATALTLEPLFPDLGSSFCAAMALPPLESIVAMTNAMQTGQIILSTPMDIASLMQFPRQVAHSYRHRAMQMQRPYMQQESPLIINPEALSYASIGNLSPAFAPSPLHYTPQSASSTQSPFLEVPSANTGFSYGTQSWGAGPSPGLPAQTYSTEDERMYGYMGGLHGGFVHSTPIWT